MTSKACKWRTEGPEHTRTKNIKLGPEVRQSYLAATKLPRIEEHKNKQITEKLKLNLLGGKIKNKRKIKGKITKNKENKQGIIRTIKTGKSLQPKDRPAGKTTTKAEVLLGRNSSRQCT